MEILKLIGKNNLSGEGRIVAVGTRIYTSIGRYHPLGGATIKSVRHSLW